jgi:hypothetical protein
MFRIRAAIRNPACNPTPFGLFLKAVGAGHGPARKAADSKRRTTMNMRFLLAAAAGTVLIAATSAMAAESVYPRTYSADDCQLLNSQIDDSIRFSSVDNSLLSAVQAQRARANMACNGGQYAAGTRQLRDILDEIIAARGNS